MRINKFLSEAGYASRREADRLIEAGKVIINGKKAVLGDTVDSSDTVKIGNKKLVLQEEKIYILFNKPVGVITTTSKSSPNNIMSALILSGKKLPKTRIFPVGRLDVPSSGLILLTNDNDLTNKLLRPGGGHEKEYRVTVERPIKDKELKILEKGIEIEKGLVTHRAKVTRVNNVTFSITITEGKRRQIRRMCEAVGYTVLRLERVRIMHLKLGNLRSGMWRYLTEKEAIELRKKLA